MSYRVLALKYRPQQLADLIGQEAIVQTIHQAILKKKVHSAYLLSGTRGVGKTSLARIFSKLLRCPHTQIVDGLLRSCDQCSDCQQIMAATSVDVLEIDGASHNGVESIRDLREQAQYLPLTGNRKIYLIDEVHMLTTAAFNALLKILEEPPKHLLFLFATTETQKIPATILSRCQRFDYRKIPVKKIETQLQYILNQEKISAQAEALQIIARSASGSLRDALSILDQVIAFSGEKITAESLRNQFGLIGKETFIEILKGIFYRNPQQALQAVAEADHKGYDLRTLTQHLIECLHAIALIHVHASPTTVDFSQEDWEELKSIASQRTLEEVEIFFQVFNQALDWMARSSQPKIILDIMMIKCSTADSLMALEHNQPTPSSPPTTFTTPDSTCNPGKASRIIEKNINPVTLWENFLKTVQQARPLLASWLEYAMILQIPSMEPPTVGNLASLILGFSPRHASIQKQVESRADQTELKKLAQNFWGFPIALQIKTEQTDVESQQKSLYERTEKDQQEKKNNIKNYAKNHPILKEAQSLFGVPLEHFELKEPSNT